MEERETQKEGENRERLVKRRRRRKREAPRKGAEDVEEERKTERDKRKNVEKR